MCVSYSDCVGYCVAALLVTGHAFFVYLFFSSF